MLLIDRVRPLLVITKIDSGYMLQDIRLSSLINLNMVKCKYRKYNTHTVNTLQRHVIYTLYNNYNKNDLTAIHREGSS